MKKEKTIGELAREHPNKTYNELDKMRQEVGVCIIGKARKDREPESELDRTKTETIMICTIELLNSLRLMSLTKNLMENYKKD